eukprot:CAMPEP_0114655126 /NCGR_PEP_ID=MMETSP0191-20121206/10890_1 /TAXON_ID=126664 /ORGANISM="Sorites sp." /LENGTH=78 /DNA_ID=CAMNT_0001870745 /DNA_START=416 /DNA_END=652 /DNA_ORIENTATION=+
MVCTPFRGLYSAFRSLQDTDFTSNSQHKRKCTQLADNVTAKSSGRGAVGRTMSSSTRSAKSEGLDLKMEICSTPPSAD